jgi:hypothetical protein
VILVMQSVPGAVSDLVSIDATGEFAGTITPVATAPGTDLTPLHKKLRAGSLSCVSQTSSTEFHSFSHSPSTRALRP